MRFVFMIILLNLYIFAQEKDSFITESEYGQDLYKNPRGIGCNKCHGEKGEGMIISKYKHKGENKVLKTESIKNLKFDEFQNAFVSKKSVMPKYFLTFSEIKTLYNYLHEDVNQTKK